MFFSSWLRKPNAKPRTSRRASSTFRPRLEVLEGRDVPSTLTVTNLNDSGHGSLRYEIAQAEQSNTPDTIVFNLNTKDPGYNGGAWTIKLTGGELALTRSMNIHDPTDTSFLLSAS